MKHLMMIAALFVSSFAFGQSAKEELDLIQSIYGMEKKDIVAEFVKVDAAQKAAFWSTYDAYEVERKELGKQRVALLEKYAMNYGTMDDATTDALIKEMNSLGMKNDKLISTYYGKMKKAGGVKAAAQFVQIESYLLSSIRVAIMDEIPFIGELDN